jgi:hypothetical protein
VRSSRGARAILVILAGATIYLLAAGWYVWRSTPLYEQWLHAELEGTEGMDPGLGVGLAMVLAEGSPLYWAVAMTGLVAAYLSLPAWLPPAPARCRGRLTALAGLSALLALLAGVGVSEALQGGAQLYGAGKVLLSVCGVWLSGAFARECLLRRCT